VTNAAARSAGSGLEQMLGVADSLTQQAAQLRTGVERFLAQIRKAA
jgi:hypothetical protein